MSTYPRLDSQGLTTLLTRLAAVIKQGHSIVNSSGTELTQRKKLKFVGATIADDVAGNTTTVIVTGGGASSLDGLSDVDLTTPANNEVLKYNSTTQKWENGTGGSNVDVMNADDVDDIKDAINIAQRTEHETMAHSDVEDIKDAFEIVASDTVKSFNSRTGYVNPTIGDYTDNQILLSSVMHIGGETQEDVAEALAALAEHGGGGGGGSGDFDKMTSQDVDDIKSAVTVNAMNLPEAMAHSDVEDVKDAFNINYVNKPIGIIIEYLGVNAPQHYLECDGSVYNIEDYQELADHINSEFGSYNYFGGDGVNTFAVPNKAVQSDSIYCIYCG